MGFWLRMGYLVGMFVKLGEIEIKTRPGDELLDFLFGFCFLSVNYKWD